ncbi:HTH DNA-binding protein [Streptococcus pyogenes]|nr:HTH DNA-binding protein [Streptococcus pyogenes]
MWFVSDDTKIYQILKKEVDILKNNLRVILARQRKKISDVHEATGVSKTTLTALYYERTENPDSKTLLKIAKCLNVTLDELLTVED